MLLSNVSIQRPSFCQFTTSPQLRWRVLFVADGNCSSKRSLKYSPAAKVLLSSLALLSWAESNYLSINHLLRKGSDSFIKISRSGRLWPFLSHFFSHVIFVCGFLPVKYLEPPKTTTERRCGTKVAAKWLRK